jgi:hypothetical protein
MTHNLKIILFYCVNTNLSLKVIETMENSETCTLLYIALRKSNLKIYDMFE